MNDFSVKFVSKKISKIRWRPTTDVKSLPSTIFVTGSWDDQQNTIGVWDLRDRLKASEEADDINTLDHEPQKIFEKPHSGDVLDIQYLSSTTFAVASSSGSVSVYRHSSRNESLSHLCTWNKQHHFKYGSPASCTCLAPKGDDWLASGGEDGRVVISALDQQQPVQTLDKADSCTINDLTFLKQTELLAVNSFGQLKTFDLRQDQKHNIVFNG
ncbi:Nucleoporin Nup43 [Bulinus truncatus]|nr:Nucleoporin Nup43 [Bulinus truncatus]